MVFLAVFLSACSFGGNQADPSGAGSRCGDGVCDVNEQNNHRLCPQDCPAKPLDNTGKPGLKSEKRCGDGVCDELEKSKGICPQDCSAAVSPDNTTPTSGGDAATNPPTETTVVASSGSPFGFHPGDTNNYSYLKDLGLSWSRDGMYWTWDWVDAKRDGNFKFKNATAPDRAGVSGSGVKIDYDSERLKVSTPSNVNLVVNICPFKKGGEFKSEEEKNIYSSFVEKTVERYDGDDDLGCTQSSPDCYNKGDNEYPAQELITRFKSNPIKYWQTCNQVTDTCTADSCQHDYTVRYAEVQKLTYQAVKKANSSAQVLIAGDSGRDYYPGVFAQLQGNYIDIVDFHRFGQENLYNPKSDFDYLKNSLKSSGFDLAKLKFWITETGTYSGAPVNRSGGHDPAQTEKQQARGLLKTYVSGLSYGIGKIFWAWGIVEGFSCDCCLFDYTGLIYDGNKERNTNNCQLQDKYDLGAGVKKLSYYTYKKMVAELGGYKSVATIQEKDGVYVYKFSKESGAVYVAWNDNSASKTVNITLDAGVQSAQAVSAVPKYGTGKEVTDYNNAFSTETKAINNNSISLEVSDVPVFVEVK